ncbi:MAG: hypothetical protein KDE47_12205 [Caldilineaceae bacterium]|nr:hypothetical protein [Caldilineaceae bacterium]
MPTLPVLSKRTGIPVAALSRSILVRWFGVGADLLLTMASIVLPQRWEQITKAEVIATDSARVMY